MQATTIKNELYIHHKMNGNWDIKSLLINLLTTHCLLYITHAFKWENEKVYDHKWKFNLDTWHPGGS